MQIIQAVMLGQLCKNLAQSYHNFHHQITARSHFFLNPHECNLHPWWHHQMETFSTLLALCEGNSPVTSEFSSQRPVTRSFDVFFDLRLKKWLSKPLTRWWFEMPLLSLWHHCNPAGTMMITKHKINILSTLSSICAEQLPLRVWHIS